MYVPQTSCSSLSMAITPGNFCCGLSSCPILSPSMKNVDDIIATCGITNTENALLFVRKRLLVLVQSLSWQMVVQNHKLNHGWNNGYTMISTVFSRLLAHLRRAAFTREHMHRPACRKRYPFLSFPYVCPEPVLAKSSFHIKTDKKFRALTAWQIGP
jgi:hypothetical protein